MILPNSVLVVASLSTASATVGTKLFAVQDASVPSFSSMLIYLQCIVTVDLIPAIRLVSSGLTSCLDIAQCPVSRPSQ